MNLFSDFTRIDAGTAFYAERQYAYLNRSARPEAEVARQHLQTWFDKYPADEQAEMLSRFQSNDDMKFHSVIFELFLHELLIQMDCKVEIHPSPAESKGKKLEFLVKENDGTEYYLEAKVISTESEEERAQQALINVVYDKINEIESPYFFIGLKLKGAPDTPQSSKKLCRNLKSWLDSLNYDEIVRRSKSEGVRNLPRHLYQHDGWNIEFFPIPKDKSRIESGNIRPRNSLGTQIHEVKEMDDRTHIFRALKKKAEKYGKLEKPYIIAANVLSMMVDSIDLFNALLGRHAITIKHNPDPNQPDSERHHRLPNGLWHGKTGMEWTRVSGILHFKRLSLWDLKGIKPTLYFNPWANKKYSGQLARFDKYTVEYDKMIFKEGINTDSFIIPKILIT